MSVWDQLSQGTGTVDMVGSFDRGMKLGDSIANTYNSGRAQGDLIDANNANNGLGDPQAILRAKQQMQYLDPTRSSAVSNAGNNQTTALGNQIDTGIKHDYLVAQQALQQIASGAPPEQVNDLFNRERDNLQQAGVSPAHIDQLIEMNAQGQDITPILQAHLANGGQKSEMPANVQEWQYYQGLGKEDQNKYLEMKRNPTYFQTSVAGVPTVITPSSNGTAQTPLTTLADETKAKEQLANATATGTKTAESEVSQSLAAAKRNPLISEAKQILGFDADKGDWGVIPEDVTSGGLNEQASRLAQQFNLVTPGAAKAQQLKTIGAALVMTVPRMEGPQSDKDTALYKDMAGQVGDASLPVEIRRAALTQIEKLDDKYASSKQSKAQPATGSANVTPNNRKVQSGNHSFTVKP